MPEIILPGTYITVRDEGLITAGRVATGNIGIVGTASKGPLGDVQILGTFTEARELFGEADDWMGGTQNELTLIRALEQVYNNGGRTVYAVRVADGATSKAAEFQFKNGADDLVKLTAKTPGAWANDILVFIRPSDGVNALVREELIGTATALNRGNVVESGINSLRVLRNTGNIDLTIRYTGAPAAGEVQINKTTGGLTFHASLAPTAADKFAVRYETSAAQKIEFHYRGGKESYLVADAAQLAEKINRSSNFLSAPVAAAFEPTFFKKQATSYAPVLGTNGAAASVNDYKSGLAKLENDIINIVLLAGQDASSGGQVASLQGHLNFTAENKRERIGLMGSGSDDLNGIAGHNLASERLIFVAPGIKDSNGSNLPGSYAAAAVAGLISSLAVQASPTNKSLTIAGLSTTFSASQLEKLVQNRVLVLEKREGFRIVKGITTATNSAWHQITTRRIVDFAIYGVRSGCNPYIGKLNNDRVRGALKATLDAFLTRMVEDEALINYELEVSANRAQEIAGECIVTMIVRPTFSIDFVKVTMFLE